MPLLLLPALLLLLDFASLFMLGHWIGSFYALLIVIVTAIIGVQLVRRVGLATLRQAQARFLSGENSSDDIMQGVSLIFAGVLLMLPGTLTDLVGLCCLLPVTNRLLAGSMLRRSARSGMFGGGSFRDIGRGPGQTSEQPFDEAGRTNDDDSARQPEEGQPLEGEYIERDHTRER